VLAAAARRVEAAAASMCRSMPSDAPGVLRRQLEHPRWEEIAKRCLACGNCTMVCPTCFCTTVEDTTDLTGRTAERWRRWDSCFTADFSYIHGGSVRRGTAARYRQWLTHKLASWHDQFGESGCVGCGRCITWCPVGIDLTAEVAAFRTADAASSP
jgi:ferredoxin